MASASRPLPLAAPGPDIDRAVRNGEAESCADRAVDQADVAAMRADKLGRDGEPEPGAATPRGALERLEQMRARPFGDAGAGIGDLDRHDRALAPARDAQLIAAGLVWRSALQRLQRVARKVEDDAEELLRIRIDREPALDRGDPAHARLR